MAAEIHTPNIWAAGPNADLAACGEHSGQTTLNGNQVTCESCKATVYIRQEHEQVMERLHTQGRDAVGYPI